MSDMQLYLIALGAIIIAAVILFNWWQERRLSREAVMRFAGPADDPLMDDFRIDPDVAVDLAEKTPYIEERIEPSYESEAETNLPPHGEAGTMEVGLEENTQSASDEDYPESDHTPEQLANDDALSHMADLESEAFDTVGIPEPTHEFTLPANIDEQIDLVVVIHLNAPCAGARLREALQPLPSFDKATQWYGLDIAGSWQALSRDQEQTDFIRMACALQLADRSGAVSRQTLLDFQTKVEDVAANLSATREWRGSSDPLRYAAELDQFCIDVDVMVGFHIQQGGNGPFAATKLRGLAEASGMRLHEDGAFHYENEAGETLFTLVDQDHHPFTPETLRAAFIRGVSFQIDVPRVRSCLEVFNQMVLVARKMESSLGGILIDDNQHALSDEAMDKIRQQLRIIYAKMVARGVIPGSQTALRLFS